MRQVKTGSKVSTKQIFIHYIFFQFLLNLSTFQQLKWKMNTQTYYLLFDPFFRKQVTGFITFVFRKLILLYFPFIDFVLGGWIMLFDRPRDWNILKLLFITLNFKKTVALPSPLKCWQHSVIFIKISVMVLFNLSNKGQHRW